MSDESLARGVSIIGHPLVLLPVSAMEFSVLQGAPAGRLAMIAGLSAVGFALLYWARENVRREKWQHVDASQPEERRQWDRVVLFCLVAATIVCWATDPLLAAGPIVVATVILISMALSPWLKLSQHVAFAVLSASIIGFASVATGAILALFVIAIGWSRLKLRRHTLREVIVGALCGALSAGVLAAFFRAVS